VWRIVVQGDVARTFVQMYSRHYDMRHARLVGNEWQQRHVLPISVYCLVVDDDSWSFAGRQESCCR
jgi:hypothetical protein